MNFNVENIKADKQHIAWIANYGLTALALFGGVATLLVLGVWFLSITFSAMLAQIFTLISLLAIAVLLWSVSASQTRAHNLDDKKLKQAQLEFIQAERLYLIEKAQLQPVFKATARAFITPAEDQQLQDEVWDEDAFIAKHFSEPNLLGVKLSFRQKGSALFSHERVVFDRSNRPSDRDGSDSNESYVALDEKEKPVFIVPLDEIASGEAGQEFVVYYIYKDLTSLSVVLKYRVFRAIENDANFWSIKNLDICFTNAYQDDLQLNSVEGCEALFVRKYEADPIVDL